MMFTKRLTESITCIIAIALLVWSAPVAAYDIGAEAPPLNPHDRGNTSEVKAVFDFRISDPEAGAFVLKAIQRIYATKPNQDIVVVFGGNSPVLLSTEREGVAPENQKYLDEVATTVSEMRRDGVQLEVCLIAVKEVCNLDPASMLPDLEHIADGFTALIQYELDGYAIVPAF